MTKTVSFLKILGYLYGAFEIREKGTSAKKVTLTDAKEDVDKSCIEVQRNTSDNAGGNPTRSFSLQHKTFSTLNYAQDFGPAGKESLKLGRELKIGYTHEKWICPVSILSYLCQNSQLCLSHWCKQWQKKTKL